MNTRREKGEKKEKENWKQRLGFRFCRFSAGDCVAKAAGVACSSCDVTAHRCGTGTPGRQAGCCCCCCRGCCARQ